MSKEIIESIASKYGFYQDEPIIKAIWNAAVEECAETIMTTYGIREGQAKILSLKIEDDEK